MIPNAAWQPTPCSGWHTLELLDRYRSALVGVVAGLRQAAPLINLADPAGWRSPAADAYLERLEDLERRCRVGACHAEDTLAQVNGYRAMVAHRMGLA